MVQQEQLLTKGFFVLIVCLLVSCGENKQAEISIPHIYKKINGVDFDQKQGVLYNKKQPFSGWLFDQYSNGDTAFKSSYYEGREHGKSLKWYDNKQPMEIRYFQYGKKTGEHTGWWKNGTCRYVYHYSDDLFDGNQKEWNVGGVLYRDGNFKKGHEDGPQRFWRPNGKLYANYIVKDGRNYGLTGVKNCENVGDSIQK